MSEHVKSDHVKSEKVRPGQMILISLRSRMMHLLWL